MTNMVFQIKRNKLNLNDDEYSNGKPNRKIKLYFFKIKVQYFILFYTLLETRKFYHSAPNIAHPQWHI